MTTANRFFQLETDLSVTSHIDSDDSEASFNDNNSTEGNSETEFKPKFDLKSNPKTNFKTQASKSLNNKWTMFYRDQTTKTTSTSSDNFSNDMVELSTCDSVTSFWQILNAIPFPSNLHRRMTSSYMFFRSGVQPTWEDESNQNGGLWRIVIKKHDDRCKYLDTFWLELLMALVGEQFRYSLDITGCVVKRRQKEDRIELWTRGHGDEERDQQIQTAIGEDLKTFLGLDNELEYTKHESVKKMDVVRRAGNRSEYTSFGSGNHHLTVSGRGSSRNREDSVKGTDKSIIRTVSNNDVFSSEYKRRSFEYMIEDHGKYRV